MIIPPDVVTAMAAAPTADPFDVGTFAERGEFPLPHSTRPAGYEGYSWQHLLDDAQGTTVRVALDDANAPLAAWVDEWVVDVAAGRYGIAVERVAAVSDAVGVAQRTAPQAGGPADGGIDLMGVDARDLGTVRSAGRLYGPWTSYLPSRRYLDPRDASLSEAFGSAAGGEAMPWGRRQFVLRTDSVKVPSPPATWPALFDWITAHPGRFAYPAPPDAVGSAFVRQACMALAPDTAVLARPLPGDNAAADAATEATLGPCWARLDALGPSLWQAGKRYPATERELDDLFSRDAVDFAMAYGGGAGEAVSGARSPTTRAFVFDAGTVARTHFLAIPADAPNKPGAMVLANFLLSPEAQYAKAQAGNGGDLTVLSLPLVPEHWRAAFQEVDAGAATVPPDVLAGHRLAEPHADWIAAIDAGWRANVGPR